jgi:Flp pilus assembly protein TadD
LQERPDDALGFLETACRLSPADAEAHYLLGVALAALQLPEDARAEFEQALVLSNDPALVAQASSRLDTLRQAPDDNTGQGGDQESIP